MFNQVTTNPFRSFWMAGFECTDQLNTHGDRVDFLHITSHLKLIDQDYQNLGIFNFKTVREGLRWSQVETRPYHYDFSTVGEMLIAGKKNGIQQIWDICHFGFPDDLSPVHPHFTRRFAALCSAFAKYYNTFDFPEPLIVTPVNEVSFMSWLGGDVAGTSPYCRHNGWEVKYAYMRAYIAGIQALKEVNQNIRILTTEPLVNIVPRFGADYNDIKNAEYHHELQYQALDILCGRICPELGGSPEYLDILGFNYYHDNQWVLDPHEILGWNDPFPNENLRPLSSLLSEAFNRYDRPVALTETSHAGTDRPAWLRYITDELMKTLQADIPLWGACIYPIIDRPNWDDLTDWHHSGIWDMDPELGIDSRKLHIPSAQALLKSQQLLAGVLSTSKNQKYYDRASRYFVRSAMHTSNFWS